MSHACSAKALPSGGHQLLGISEVLSDYAGANSATTGLLPQFLLCSVTDCSFALESELAVALTCSCQVALPARPDPHLSRAREVILGFNNQSRD